MPALLYDPVAQKLVSDGGKLRYGETGDPCCCVQGIGNCVDLFNYVNTKRAFVTVSATSNLPQCPGCPSLNGGYVFTRNTGSLSCTVGYTVKWGALPAAREVAALCQFPGEQPRAAAIFAVGIICGGSFSTSFLVDLIGYYNSPLGFCIVWATKATVPFPWTPGPIVLSPVAGAPCQVNATLTFDP